MKVSISDDESCKILKKIGWNNEEISRFISHFEEYSKSGKVSSFLRNTCVLIEAVN